MVARQSSGPMKTNHAWIADCTWRGMASSCEDIFGVSPFVRTPWGIWCELRGCKPRGRQWRESSPPESLCETLRMKQDSKSPCSSKAAGIGFIVVRLLLQSSNLLSIDPGTFSDACFLGGGECSHNANNWPIRIKTTRSATSLVFAISWP